MVKKPSPVPNTMLGRSVVKSTPEARTACSASHLARWYGKRGSGSAPMALMYTMRPTPAARAALTRFSVPPRITASNVCPPFSRMTATRWTTASHPASAASSPSPLTTSARTTLTPSRGATARLPRAISTTSWSASSSARATFLPTKPVPPVMAMRTWSILHC